MTTWNQRMWLACLGLLASCLAGQPNNGDESQGQELSIRTETSLACDPSFFTLAPEEVIAKADDCSTSFGESVRTSEADSERAWMTS